MAALVEFINAIHKNPSIHRIEEHDMLKWVKAYRKLQDADALKPERIERFMKLLVLIEENLRVIQYQ